MEREERRRRKDIKRDKGRETERRRGKEEEREKGREREREREREIEISKSNFVRNSFCVIYFFPKKILMINFIPFGPKLNVQWQNPNGFFV